MTDPESYTYAQAGVSIEAGNALVRAIGPLARSTRRPGADADLGGFGGVFDLRATGYSDPLLVAWRDPSHPAHNRLIVNPHAAFYSVEGLLDMRLKGAEACRRAVLGLPLRNVVN